MLNIVPANIDQDKDIIQELFWEYLSWANASLNEEFQINFDIKSSLKEDMEHLQKYFPPTGLLLLAYQENKTAGIACMKKDRK